MIELEKDEKFIVEVRKHWIVLAIQASFLVLLLPAPVLFFSLLPIDKFLNVSGNYFMLSMFFTLIWTLIIWVAFFIMWTFHHLDSWIITDKRIVDVEQYGFFSRDVTSFRLDKIQDITVETHGILATLFGFGALFVQTAGEKRTLALPLARHPEKMKQLIIELSNNQIEQFPHNNEV